MEAPLTKPEGSSLPSSEFGKPSYIQRTAQTAELFEIVKALAVIQDGLRQFVMAGGLLKTPYVNDKGILVLAIKLTGHGLGVGPEGNILIDGQSVMEGRTE